MENQNTPRLTEAHVRRLASEQSFERGEEYYEAGAITDPVRQGMELRAECEGSQYQSYRVRATLTPDGIASAACSCPYDWGGACKHLVALLLTYVHEPGSFRSMESLEAMLESRSKEQLIALIGQMIQRDPNLLSLVELSEATLQGRPIDVSTYRRQVLHILGDDDPDDIELELQALGNTARGLKDAGDWLNAGAIYQVALSETVDRYEDWLQMMDEDGEICIVMDALAEGLGECLAQCGPDDEVRRPWLETLLDAELTDTRIGGIDLAPSAWDALVEHATDDDWDWIEDEIRNQIAATSGWGREALVSMLQARYQRDDQQAASTELIRELGTPEQRARLLAAEGDIDGAVSLMRQILPDKPGLIRDFADVLVEASAEAEAVTLTTDHVRQTGAHSRGVEWLAAHYQKRGTPEQALEWQQVLFLQNPSVERFEALKEASCKAGTWENVRAQALRSLERDNRTSVLIGIALHENDVSRALELLKQPRGFGWGDHRLEVAKAAEASHPQEALGLYQQLVQQGINGRTRDSYRKAAEHLVRIKSVHHGIGTSSEWERYIQALRAEYARRPALQDEWRKAGV